MRETNCVTTNCVRINCVTMQNIELLSSEFSKSNLTLSEPKCESNFDINSFNFTQFDFPNPENIIKPFTWREYCKIVFYVIAIIAVMIGNVGVILAVAFNRSLRITINYYLVNLAVADIFICVCCMWVHLINNLMEPLYVLGPIICKFNGFAQSKFAETSFPNKI